jgi:hypothetical protein
MAKTNTTATAAVTPVLSLFWNKKLRISFSGLSLLLVLAFVPVDELVPPVDENMPLLDKSAAVLDELLYESAVDELGVGMVKFPQ